MSGWQSRLRALLAGNGLFGVDPRRVARVPAPRDPEHDLAYDGPPPAHPWVDDYDRPREQPLWAPPPRPVPPLRRSDVVRAGVLFVLTVGSTAFTLGWVYSAAIILILLCHEMGHYLMCRRYRVDASLPLFIPMPLSPFGTMGAIIRMRDTIRDRRALFDIGIAGPLAGLVPAVLAVWWGIQHATIADRRLMPDGAVSFGESILIQALSALRFPGRGPEQEIVIGPVGFAGWAGLYVTALNLIPIGQLDGGHVLYGLLGRRSRPVFTALMAAFVLATVLFQAYWFSLILVLVFLLGYQHPRTRDEHVPLGPGRVWLGLLALLVFVLCFVPQPISVR